MGNLNFNEVGQKIRINLGDDISDATPTLILQPEVGPTKEITTGVTIPWVDVRVGNDILYAKTYLEYTTVAGDLDYVGRWRFKCKLEFSSTDIRQTDYQKFRVLP